MQQDHMQQERQQYNRITELLGVKPYVTGQFPCSRQVRARGETHKMVSAPPSPVLYHLACSGSKYSVTSISLNKLAR